MCWLWCELNKTVRFRIREDDAGAEFAGFIQGHHGVGHDDDNIAGVNLARRRTVEAYHAAVSGAFDGIGVKTFAVVIVYDLYALAGDYAGGFHKCAVNCYATYIVEVGFSHLHTVNL